MADDRSSRDCISRSVYYRLKFRGLYGRSRDIEHFASNPVLLFRNAALHSRTHYRYHRVCHDHRPIFWNQILPKISKSYGYYQLKEGLDTCWNEVEAKRMSTMNRSILRRKPFFNSAEVMEWEERGLKPQEEQAEDCEKGGRGDRNGPQT